MTDISYITYQYVTVGEEKDLIANINANLRLPELAGCAAQMVVDHTSVADAFCKGALNFTK